MLAAHSIGPDIPIENYEGVIEVYKKYREARSSKNKVMRNKERD